MVADTSLQAFKGLLRTRHFSKQCHSILTHLYGSAEQSARLMALALNNEPSSLSHSIQLLLRQGLIEVSKKDTCSTTGRTVKFYRIVQLNN